MRSIRLSLMVYFLVLLSVSLGVASLLVYRIAQQTLEAKEEAAGKLIEARYEERRREAESRLNERLLAQAKNLAGRVRSRTRWERIASNHVNIRGVVGLMTAPFLPSGWSNVPLWAMQGAMPKRDRGRWSTIHPAQQQMWFPELIELAIGDEVALPEEGDGPRIYSLIQTNGWSRSLAIPSVGNLPLPNEENYAPDQRLTWTMDEQLLENGVRIHRVLFRARLNLQDSPMPPPPPSKGPPPMPRFIRPSPALIIQCAANVRELEDVLEESRLQRDREREDLRAETRAILIRQRNWLLIISGVTFAATVVGTIGLVWLGLRPIRRLSDAVSRVTSRDFTLRLDAGKMPRELNPIVDRLEATLDQLRRAFAREKQATADISHELRTPLAALLTTIEIGLRKQRTPDHYRELLADCRVSVQQMHQIVERLLTLARLDAGVDRLRAQSVDVLELLEQCATVVRPLAEAKGVQIAVNKPVEAIPSKSPVIEDGRQRVSTDPDKLREVVNNLLHNAIQYNRPEGRIDLNVVRENGHVRLEVQDTGIGIPAESRELIFERFYRADPSRTTDGMNAGLGLAIVKEYVELMGGTISVESTVGQGSTFRIELPAERPALTA